MLGLGLGILVLGLLSTGRRALDTAGRAAALFEGLTGARIFELSPPPPMIGDGAANQGTQLGLADALTTWFGPPTRRSALASKSLLLGASGDTS